MIRFKNLFKESITKNVLFLVMLSVLSIAALLFAGYASDASNKKSTVELENQRNRSLLGKAILKKLLLIDLDVYRLVMSSDKRKFLAYEQTILKHAQGIKQALGVLQKGGEFVDVLPANFYDRDEILERVPYMPPSPGYEIDVIDLMPKIMEIEDNVQDLVRLKADIVDVAPYETGKIQRHVRLAMMQLETLFLRSRENANKITFETNRMIAELEKKRIASRVFWDVVISAVIIVVFLGCSLLFVLILIRINTIIKERRKDTEELLQAKESISTILAALPVGVVVIRPDRTVSMVNRAGLTLLEAENEEVILGKRCNEIFCLSDAFNCPLLETYMERHDSEIELKTLRGKRLSVIKNAMTIILNGEQVVLEAFMDISDRIKAEKELKESQRFIQAVFESLPAGVVVIDAETRTIMDVNRTGQAMIGTAREDIVGSICHNFICPAEKGRCPIMDLCMLVDTSERCLLTAGGKSLEILKSVEILEMAGRKVLVESFVDISQLKKVERELILARERADEANAAKSFWLI